MAVAIIKMVIGAIGIIGFTCLTYIFAKTPIKDKDDHDLATNKNIREIIDIEDETDILVQ